MLNEDQVSSKDPSDINLSLILKEFILEKLKRRDSLFTVVRTKSKKARMKAKNKIKEASGGSIKKRNSRKQKKKEIIEEKPLSVISSPLKDISRQLSEEKVIKPKIIRCPPGNIIINNYYNFFNQNLADPGRTINLFTQQICNESVKIENIIPNNMNVIIEEFKNAGNIIKKDIQLAEPIQIVKKSIYYIITYLIIIRERETTKS
jgi:hypothetical protein